jgi:hypothetical protein
VAKGWDDLMFHPSPKQLQVWEGRLPIFPTFDVRSGRDTVIRIANDTGTTYRAPIPMHAHRHGRSFLSIISARSLSSLSLVFGLTASALFFSWTRLLMPRAWRRRPQRWRYPSRGAFYHGPWSGVSRLDTTGVPCLVA